MKKSLLAMTALAAMLFAGCTSSDELTTLESIKQADNAPTPVSFGTYMGKQATTRSIYSGSNGAITTDALLQAKRFGIFAYYTGTNTYNEKNGPYNAAGKIAPNFMWNQQVTWDNTNSIWTYSPLKYWPNNISTSSVDNSAGATGSENGGKLTFFAYAPYVPAAASTGTVTSNPTEGIIKFSDYDDTGDPTINYVVPDAGADIVDLLWGTYGTTTTNVNSTGNAGVSSTAGSYVAAPVANRSTWQEDIAYHAPGGGYKLNADLTKQETDGNVGFAFKHALAKFGGYAGMKIVTDVDKSSDPYVSGGSLDATNDRVTVKAITITAKAKNSAGSKYYTTQAGTFNLATGKWTITGAEDASATGTTYTITTAMMNSEIAEPASVTVWANVSSITGVPTTPVNVYGSLANETQPVVFIPGTKPELTVTIDYMVRTKDDNLANGYSEVEQTITNKVTFANVVELNKYYSLTIHLGLTGVKFTATAADWEDSGATVTTVNLPINVH